MHARLYLRSHRSVLLNVFYPLDPLHVSFSGHGLTPAHSKTPLWKGLSGGGNLACFSGEAMEEMARVGSPSFRVKLRCSVLFTEKMILLSVVKPGILALLCKNIE